MSSIMYLRSRPVLFYCESIATPALLRRRNWAGTHRNWVPASRIDFRRLLRSSNTFRAFFRLLCKAFSTSIVFLPSETFPAFPCLSLPLLLLLRMLRITLFLQGALSRDCFCAHVNKRLSVIAPLLGVVAHWQRPLTTKDVDVDELIGSNVDSIPLMYPLSYAYYSVYRTLIRCNPWR